MFSYKLCVTCIMYICKQRPKGATLKLFNGFVVNTLLQITLSKIKGFSAWPCKIEMPPEHLKKTITKKSSSSHVFTNSETTNLQFFSQNLIFFVFSTMSKFLSRSKQTKITNMTVFWKTFYDHLKENKENFAIFFLHS